MWNPEKFVNQWRLKEAQAKNAFEGKEQSLSSQFQKLSTKSKELRDEHISVIGSVGADVSEFIGKTELISSVYTIVKKKKDAVKVTIQASGALDFDKELNLSEVASAQAELKNVRDASDKAQSEEEKRLCDQNGQGLSLVREEVEVKSRQLQDNERQVQNQKEDSEKNKTERDLQRSAEKLQNQKSLEQGAEDFLNELHLIHKRILDIETENDSAPSEIEGLELEIMLCKERQAKKTKRSYRVAFDEGKNQAYVYSPVQLADSFEVATEDSVDEALDLSTHNHSELQSIKQRTKLPTQIIPVKSKPVERFRIPKVPRVPSRQNKRPLPSALPRVFTSANGPKTKAPSVAVDLASPMITDSDMSSASEAAKKMYLPDLQLYMSGCSQLLNNAQVNSEQYKPTQGYWNNNKVVTVRKIFDPALQVLPPREVLNRSVVFDATDFPFEIFRQ